jgi:hypothetical protein
MQMTSHTGQERFVMRSSCEVPRVFNTLGVSSDQLDNTAFVVVNTKDSGSSYSVHFLPVRLDRQSFDVTVRSHLPHVVGDWFSTASSSRFYSVPPRMFPL